MLVRRTVRLPGAWRGRLDVVQERLGADAVVVALVGGMPSMGGLLRACVALGIDHLAWNEEGWRYDDLDWIAAFPVDASHAERLEARTLLCSSRPIRWVKASTGLGHGEARVRISPALRATIGLGLEALEARFAELDPSALRQEVQRGD